MSLRPFAEYHLLSTHPGAVVRFASGAACAVLSDDVFEVGRSPQHAVQVSFPTSDFRGWGGRANHRLTWEDDAFWLHHLGHMGVITVDGEPLPLGVRRHALRDGSRVEPSDGLVFELRLRPDLEALWDELLAAGLHRDGRPEVLMDALHERTGLDRPGVELALRHFATRRGG